MKIKIKMRTFITSLLCLLIAGAIEAQVEPKGFKALRHEGQIYLTGGVSSLKYTLAKGGESKGGLGYGAGLAYICKISSTVGFSTGLELSSIQGKASYKSLTETYDAIDDRSVTMEYTYSINNYKEEQNLKILSIPIMARVQIPAGEDNSSSAYLAGGVKIGFPVSSKAIISGDNITSTGYYRQENIPYPNLPEHGFLLDANIRNQKSRISAFKTMTSLALEAGVRFERSFGALSAGLYLDYMLNDSNIARDKHLLNYLRTLSYESVLNTALADKLKTMSIGVKVGFSIF